MCLMIIGSVFTGRRVLASVLTVTLALVIAWCWKDSRPPVQPVRGLVLLNGNPVPAAIVTFHPLTSEGAPDSKPPSPSAQTDDQGYFTLTSYRSGDGALEGEYAVTVTWFRSYPPEPVPGVDPVTVNYLPTRYANPATSQLKATVSKGENELPAFHVSAQ